MFQTLPKRVFTAIALVGVTGAGALLLVLNGVTPVANANDSHHAEAFPHMAATSGPMSHGMSGTPMPGMNMPQEFDLMFIDMMIPHHEGAIAMAEVALEKGEHQEVKDLAKAIIESQQAEIDQMMGWRDEWYPNAPMMPMEQMAQMMGGMMPSMMATPAMDGMGMTSMPGHMGDATADAEMLRNATGPFDQAFIEMMIPHHQSAVAMAQVALQHAIHPEIRSLAQAIVDAQEIEIAQMQSWLVEWYGATPTA